MAETITLVALAAFFVFMTIFHNLHKWCAPHTVEPTTATATDDTVAQSEPSPLNDDGLPTTPYDPACATPTGAYAIDVADASPGKISFIRFSGYTDSDASSMSDSDRSTAMSFWTWLSSTKKSEVRSPTIVSPVTPPVPAPSALPPRSYIPRVRDDSFDDDPDGVYTVKIVALNGMAERNLLAYKPHNPRPLTTTQAKKSATTRVYHL